MRVFNEKCETILRPNLEICQLSSISNASNSFRRVFTIRELFECALFDFKHYVMNLGAVNSYYTDSEVFFDIAFFRLFYRMAESHFYAEMDVNPRLAHLETIK